MLSVFIVISVENNAGLSILYSSFFQSQSELIHSVIQRCVLHKKIHKRTAFTESPETQKLPWSNKAPNIEGLRKASLAIKQKRLTIFILPLYPDFTV